MKAKIDEYKTNREDQEFRRLVNVHQNFQKGSQPRNNIVQDEKGDFLTDSQAFWLSGGSISRSYSMFTWLMMLGR